VRALFEECVSSEREGESQIEEERERERKRAMLRSRTGQANPVAIILPRVE